MVADCAYRPSCLASKWIFTIWMSFSILKGPNHFLIQTCCTIIFGLWYFTFLCLFYPSVLLIYYFEHYSCQHEENHSMQYLKVTRNTIYKDHLWSDSARNSPLAKSGIPILQHDFIECKPPYYYWLWTVGTFKCIITRHQHANACQRSQLLKTILRQYLSLQQMEKSQWHTGLLMQYNANNNSLLCFNSLDLIPYCLMWICHINVLHMSVLYHVALFRKQLFCLTDKLGFSFLFTV